MTEPAAPAAPVPGRTWPVRLRPVGRWALRLVVALSGAVLGILLLGQISAPIGPFDAELSFRPSLSGGAELSIPPLGALSVDAYDGPLALDIQLRRIDQLRAESLASHPAWVDRIVDDVSSDLQSAVVRLVWWTAGSAVLGAALASLLLLRRWREPLIAAGTTVVLLAGTGGLGALTWRPEALSTPTYTGLLVNANSLLGGAGNIVARFDAYRESLEDVVGNVSALYATLTTLPEPVTSDPDIVALLHVSDLHLNPAGFDLVEQVVEQFDVDGVLDTGDITDWGSSSESRLITAVGDLDVPYVFVRGNHDSAATAEVIAAQDNGAVLDYSGTEVAGIGVIGAPDPRFAPDRVTGEESFSEETMRETGARLAEVADDLDPAPVIAMVHHPDATPALDGVVPLVLAGHTHNREATRLEGGSLLMVQGSTGGAGLRALRGDYPEPLTATVLYVDRTTGQLRAYDDITLGGLGLTEATIQRTVVEPPPEGADDGTDETGDAIGTREPGD